MFPLNCWYVIATAEEITPQPLGRTLCAQPVVLFRNTAGEAVALEDYCPHRGLPLSMGRVDGDRLICGYHGLTVDCGGRCVAMPSQSDKITRLRGARAYPLVEQQGYIWLWPGDAEQADPALVPDLHWLSSPDWAFRGGYYHLSCDYRLLIDNLMDLTHETYVHADSIGQPEIDEAEPVLEGDDNEVRLSRVMEGINPPPFWQAALQGGGLAHDVPCDRWQVCRFQPPGQVMIEVGVAHAGTGGPQASLAHRASGVVVDLITPETEHSCHYFWGMARNFCVDDDDLSEQILASQGQIFAEDVDVLNAQHANLQQFSDRRLVTLNTDRGGANARKMLERMMQAEHN